MRTKIPTTPDLLHDAAFEDVAFDDDALEPLPVVIDGVTRDPVPVELDAVAALVSDSFAVNERCELVGSRIVEAPGWRVLTPWVHPPPVVPFVRLTAPDTFSRMVAVDPSYLMALPAWWRRRVRGDRYEPVRNFSLFEPRGVSGVWTARASLRWRLRRRALPMELTLWPHFEGWSRLNVRPLRRTRPSVAYFRAGHRALDALCAELRDELPAVGVVSARRSATSPR